MTTHTSALTLEETNLSEYRAAYLNRQLEIEKGKLVVVVCLFYFGGPTAKGYFKGNRRWEKERRGRQLKSINDPEGRLRDRRSSDRG